MEQLSMRELLFIVVACVVLLIVAFMLLNDDKYHVDKDGNLEGAGALQSYEAPEHIQENELYWSV